MGLLYNVNKYLSNKSSKEIQQKVHKELGIKRSIKTKKLTTKNEAKGQ